MLKKLLDHKIRALVFIVLVLLLAGIRNYEEILFYDPFLKFFRGEFANQPLPEFNGMHLLLSLIFRYFLNTAVSLAIIYAVFKDAELVKFSAILYVVFFILLMAAFFSILFFFGENDLVLFYVRRFLIQPVFVILFIPAFYYQKQLSKK